MTEPTPAFATYVGVDVSKDILDAHLVGTHRIFPNDPEGFAALRAALPALPQPVCVVLEPSGGYEAPLLLALHDARVPVARVNAKRVRDFARADGRLAKTDVLDARTLADYGRLHQPRPLAPPDHLRDELRERSQRRAQLVAMRATERTRLHGAGPTPRASIEKVVAFLSTCIAELDDDIARRIQDWPEAKETARILRSAPGVGPTVASRLVACLPELGKIDGKAITALVGLAPFNADSGHHHGRRFIQGGRADVRVSLFQAAHVAVHLTRDDNDLRRLFKRLLAAGKPYKVAMVAAAHKLLLRLNAMLRDNTLWNEATTA